MQCLIHYRTKDLQRPGYSKIVLIQTDNQDVDISKLRRTGSHLLCLETFQGCDLVVSRHYHGHLLGRREKQLLICLSYLLLTFGSVVVNWISPMESAPEGSVHNHSEWTSSVLTRDVFFHLFEIGHILPFLLTWMAKVLDRGQERQSLSKPQMRFAVANTVFSIC